MFIMTGMVTITVMFSMTVMVTITDMFIMFSAPLLRYVQIPQSVNIKDALESVAGGRGRYSVLCSVLCRAVPCRAVLCGTCDDMAMCFHVHCPGVRGVVEGGARCPVTGPRYSRAGS